jgi:hypothetical protein
VYRKFMPRGQCTEPVSHWSSARLRRSGCIPASPYPP